MHAMLWAYYQVLTCAVHDPDESPGLQARLSDIGGTLAGVDKRQKVCRLFRLVHGQPCE
jgi:hypothetical protein